MIIERLQAENVLKYARLDLDDIPAAGLIAIVGDNESGKSSIGEAVCFALFGRTFSLGPDELGKVIRWGESRCSIRLDLRTPDGHFCFMYRDGCSISRQQYITWQQSSNRPCLSLVQCGSHCLCRLSLCFSSDDTRVQPAWNALHQCCEDSNKAPSNGVA